METMKQNFRPQSLYNYQRSMSTKRLMLACFVIGLFAGALIGLVTG